MFKTITDHYETLRDEIGDRTGIGESDERNVGIGPTESVLAFAAALGATFITRELLEATWRTTLDREPPKNPASREVAWKEAMMWGAASGALIGIARIASRRVSTGALRNFRS